MLHSDTPNVLMFHYAGNLTLGHPGMLVQALTDIPQGGDIFNSYYHHKKSLTAREEALEAGEGGLKGQQTVISGAVKTWGFGTDQQDDAGFVHLEWGT